MYNAGYDGSPMDAGRNAGLQYSPYQVPNAARIPAPKGRGVSFEKNQGFGGGQGAGGYPRHGELPNEVTGGVGYLNEQIGRRAAMESSPLRNASPRR